MPIRTGDQFLAALRDDRQIFIDGERVPDVTTDPRFAGAAQSMAELYDMQHDPARASGWCSPRPPAAGRLVFRSSCRARSTT